MAVGRGRGGAEGSTGGQDGAAGACGPSPLLDSEDAASNLPHPTSRLLPCSGHGIDPTVSQLIPPAPSQHMAPRTLLPLCPTTQHLPRPTTRLPLHPTTQFLPCPTMQLPPHPSQEDPSTSQLMAPPVSQRAALTLSHHTAPTMSQGSGPMLSWAVVPCSLPLYFGCSFSTSSVCSIPAMKTRKPRLCNLGFKDGVSVMEFVSEFCLQ